MSLEQAVQENTAAIRELIAVLQGPNPVKGALAKEKPAAGKSVITSDTPQFGPDHMRLLEEAKKKDATREADEAATKKAAEKIAEENNLGASIDKTYTYDELATEFLKLVKSDKPAALAILASLKISSLKEIKGKDVLYTAIAFKIAEARGTVVA
jgi:hypothetical protein